METIIQWISENLGNSDSFFYKIIMSFLVALGVFGLRRVLHFLLIQGIEDVKKKYNWQKGVSYSTYVLFFVIISPIWIVELHSLGTFLGLVSAGLAVALKEPISNLFAWVYIVTKKPFAMGDRIQIENFEGDVLDIGFFEFTILEIKNWVEADQSTGRIIHMPNGVLFSQGVVNYNQAMDFIWNEVPIVITFESNWEKAKSILLEIEENVLKKLVTHAESNLETASKKYNVVYTTLDPTVYTAIKENGVQLTLRYMCNPRMRRDSQQAAIEAILRAFAQNDDITFAYPTMRYYRKDEGRETKMVFEK
jgi:small-conductance mechanosensitive channel